MSGKRVAEWSWKGIASFILAFIYIIPPSIELFKKDKNYIENVFSGGKSGGAGASGYWEDIDTGN